jgi:hypothetical protein
MHVFKFIVSFLAVGGATYALIKINEMPPWLIAVTIAMAIAALITALPHLPEAIVALENVGRKIAAARPAVAPGQAPPSRDQAPPYVPPRPAYEYKPVVPPTPAPPKCAALVMSIQGGWGGSAGTGLKCADRLERARASCSAHTSGSCGNYAAGPWVAGIHCGMRMPHGGRRNSFAGYGVTEADAFARALQHAGAQGFPSQSCKRRVAISADEAAPRRY